MHAQSVKDLTSWDDTMITWMTSASASFEDLLRPVMMAASNTWLTKPGFDSDEYRDKGEFQVWLLHGWLSWVTFCPVDVFLVQV